MASTELREAAQQALEALNHVNVQDRVEIINNLRAALAEPEPPPEAQTEAERMAYCAGWWDALEKARKAEPVQEPVAWMHTDPDNSRVKFLVWRENEPAFRGVWIKTPLFTSLPQRKPLTEEEILSLFRKSGSPVLFGRAIERWLRGHA